MIVYSTIGGFFFLLSVFVGLVQFLKDLISGNVVIKNNEVIFELDSMYQFLILGNVDKRKLFVQRLQVSIPNIR